MPKRWRSRVLVLCAVGLLGCGSGLAGEDDAREAGGALFLRAFSSFDDVSQRARVHLARTQGRSGEARQILRFDDPLGTVYSLVGAQVWVESIALTFWSERPCAQVLAESQEAFAGLVCDGERLRLQGPFAVDLVKGEVLAGASVRAARAQVGWAIPALDYRQVELELGPAPAGSLMGGVTVWGEADFQVNAAIRRLDVRFAVRTRVSRAVRAPVAQGAALVVWADVARWLDHIPLTECLERGHLSAQHGEVSLDRELNAPALAYFVDEPPRDCQDAQAHFGRNLRRSLSVEIRARHAGE